MVNDQIVNLKNEFGNVYAIIFDEAYFHETPQNREPVEWYYTIPARYGSFSPFVGNTIAFFCTANRIKDQLLKKYQEKVTLYVEGDDESIMIFDKKHFPEISKLAQAKKRPGRKKLGSKEREQLLEAGNRYRFTGKPLQNPALEGAISKWEDIMVRENH
jgi:hypothetical protein